MRAQPTVHALSSDPWYSRPLLDLTGGWLQARPHAQVRSFSPAGCRRPLAVNRGTGGLRWGVAASRGKKKKRERGALQCRRGWPRSGTAGHGRALLEPAHALASDVVGHVMYQHAFRRTAVRPLGPSKAPLLSPLRQFRSCNPPAPLCQGPSGPHHTQPKGGGGRPGLSQTTVAEVRLVRTWGAGNGKAQRARKGLAITTRSASAHLLDPSARARSHTHTLMHGGMTRSQAKGEVGARRREGCPAQRPGKNPPSASTLRASRTDHYNYS